MKALLIIILFISINSNAQIRKDHVLHSGAGITIATSMYTIGQFSKREMNPVSPSLVAITAGTFKEFHDVFRGGRFSTKDLLITSISGIIINWLLRLMWKPKKSKVIEIEKFNPQLILKQQNNEQ